MKISWIKYANDTKSFSLPEKLGFDVFKLQDLEQTDKKIEELVKKQYDTIIVSNDVASFSENIIKKYSQNEEINMFYEQFVIDFGSRFYRLNLKNNFTDIIFICVGSNKITGDSLGPIVGAKLKQKLGTNIAIIGTTETPVNYENIKEIIDNIKLGWNNIRKSSKQWHIFRITYKYKRSSRQR